MVKFLHTADWQIGMKAVHVGSAGARVRDERLNAAARVIEIARKAGAEFILVAGDTFEDNGVDRVMVQKVADILASFSDPVYLIPGNHDPLMPGSVWEHPAWKQTSTIHVLREEKPVQVPGGTLYPCPAREKYSRKDPTAWIIANDEGGTRIGLAHGTVEGVHQDEPDFPVPRDAASRSRLDYLALGHWHSTVTYPGQDGAVRMAYSGTHETTKFGERDSGNALIVEIPEAGAPSLITPVRTGGLLWKVIEADLREAGDLASVRAQIETLESPLSTLLELRLAGLLPAQDCDEFLRIKELLASRSLFGRIETSQLRPSPEDDSWLAGLPPGAIREAGAKLRQLTDPHYAGQRPDGASPEVASRAVLELYALTTEIRT